MANSFTNITDKILARGLTVLREAAIMPRLVNVDFNNEAASKGSTIDVPKSVSQTVADVSAGAANITPAAKTPGLVQVSMSNWKKTDFFMTDKEMLEVDRNQHFVPHQTEEAARALANDIDTAIHNEYTGIYGFVGTAGTVPFSTVKTATDARKVLNQQLAPVGPARSIVLDPTAESQALQLPAYSDVEKTADRPVKIEGEIGRKFGFDHFMPGDLGTDGPGGVSPGLSRYRADAGAADVTRLRLDVRLKRFALYATIVAALPAAVVGLSLLGVDVPPWATAAEHRHLTGRVDRIKVDVLQTQIERRRLQLYANQAQQDQYRVRGDLIPEIMLRAQADLLTRIEYLEKQLQGLVGRIIR